MTGSLQPDPDAAADFYGGRFGWEFEDAMMLFSNQSAPTNLKTLVGRIAPRPVFFIYGQHDQDNVRGRSFCHHF